MTAYFYFRHEYLYYFVVDIKVKINVLVRLYFIWFVVGIHTSHSVLHHFLHFSQAEVPFQITANNVRRINTDFFHPIGQSRVYLEVFEVEITC